MSSSASGAEHLTPNTQNLSRLDILRGLNRSLWEGVWATIWMVLTTGAFQTGFAQSLIGMTPFALGLMAGLPAAVNLLQIPASMYVERRGERRRFVGFVSVTGRLLWIPILLIPFVLPPESRLPMYLALLALSSALLSLGVPAWTSWMSDLVPAGSRGEYFARRNQVAGLVAMLVPLPAGAFLDQAVKYGRFDPRVGFAVLFSIACAAALGSFAMILRQPEPPMARPEGERPNPFRSLGTPFQDPNFRPFMLYAVMVVIGQGLAGQFFIAWQVGKDTLNQPYLLVQVLSVVASLGSLLTTPVWGYLADKYGSRPILMIATAGTVLAPLLWTLTVPGAFWWDVAVIVVLNLASGASWAGVGLTQFNLLLGLTEPTARSTYVAVYSAFTGIIGGIAPIVGGALMTALQPVAVPLGPLVLNNYKILFLITSAVRMSCVWLLTRIPAQESHGARYVLEQLASSRPLSSYFTARRLSRPTTETARRQVVEELAHLRSPLAVEELGNALDDVSPDVRERAVDALAAIRDPRAVPALAAKLFDPAAGLGERAAQALGEIGDGTATPYLVAAVHGPDAGVRLAAIRALGRVARPQETPDALPALLSALTTTHPTPCEAACLSLVALAPRMSREQASLALPLLLALLKPDVERGMRFAAARALGVLTPEPDPALSGYRAVSATLRDEDDPATVAQSAAALAHLGGAAHCPATETLDVLLPLLYRVEPSRLAYKQMLSVLADLALPPDIFYPYLSLADLPRDEAVGRLITEVRDLARKSDRLPPEYATDLASWSTAAMDAYTSGEYARLHSLLRLLTPSESAPPGDADAAERLRAALAERARSGDGGAEESLLAILLTRARL